ncbi:calcium-binding protein, partial [Neisseria sp. P0015.S006]
GDGIVILRGDHGIVYLDGYEGEYVLDGGIGADVMRGGNVNDTYYVDSQNDVVIEEAIGGFDSVYTGMTYLLPTHVENLT